MSSSVIEKELTCSICTDLLYDPVTFLDCLHTNCGSCAKAWFQSLSNNAANAPVASSSAPAAVAKYTCPVCRAVVRATKHNATLQSLIEDFIARNPDKDRTQEEKDAVRKIYTPGSGVLPGEGSHASPPTLPNRRQAPVGVNAWGAPSRSPDPRSQPYFQYREARRGSMGGRGAAAPPPSLVETLVNTTEQTCFHCQKRVDFAARCFCPHCNIITCLSCGRDGRTCRTPADGHTCTMHKLQLNPRHIQSGIFCDICETWCDNSFSGNETNAYFWACEVCDHGNWVVCRTCVSKGNSCTHELKLYTNQRPPTRGPIRGTLGQNHHAIYTELVRTSATVNIDLNTQLSAFGYVRAISLQINCDNCLEVIPPNHSYLHCTECLDGYWDNCMNCWYVMSEQIGGNAEGFQCRYGHQMALLTQNGEKGTHKIIQDVPHDPPDFVSRDPRNENGREVVPQPRTATAIKSHWPEAQESNIETVWRQDVPGMRVRDYGGLLGFPVKAEITNVWIAFTEGEGFDRVEYLWGWYSGIGGLFPRDCVEFTS